MNYVQRLESITTIKQLYEFREDLISEQLQIHKDGACNFTEEHATNLNNAGFYKDRVEKIIEHREKKGEFLPSMTNFFTEEDIIRLQNEVHEIVGDGPAMIPFNNLLGVN